MIDFASWRRIADNHHTRDSAKVVLTDFSDPGDILCVHVEITKVTYFGDGSNYCFDGERDSYAK
jgi:hypothetical protein